MRNEVTLFNLFNKNKKCANIYCNQKGEYRIKGGGVRCLLDWFCEYHYKQAALAYIRTKKWIEEQDDRVEEEEEQYSNTLK